MLSQTPMDGGSISLISIDLGATEQKKRPEVAKMTSSRDANRTTKEGQSAYHQGKNVRDNPYERGSENWFNWDQGWSGEKAIHGHQRT